MDNDDVKNHVSSDPQEFYEKWFETINLAGKEFELPKISKHFDHLSINSELPMPKYSFQNLDNLFLSTIEKAINFQVNFTTSSSSTNQLGTMTNFPSTPLVQNHQVSHAKDNLSQIPLVQSTQIHLMTKTISRSIRNVIKPSYNVSNNNLNFIMNPFHMRNSHQHQGYFRYYDHQSFSNSYATSFIGITKSLLYYPSFSDTNLMVNKDTYDQTFFTSTLTSSNDSDHKTLVNHCGSISFFQKQQRYDETCSGVLAMKIDPQNQDFGVSLSQFDVDDKNLFLPCNKKRASSAMINNIVGNKEKIDSHRSVDQYGDEHRCDKCNVSFATGNALGGHMSHHSKRRKKEAMKIWKKNNPGAKYSFFDFVDSLGFQGC